MPCFVSLFLFLFPPPPCHFNGAISRADNSATHTCFYKSTLHLRCFSKIKTTLKSFSIIQQNCFAFWFCLHLGKLPSLNTTFAAIVQFFYRHNAWMSILPAQMRAPSFIFLPSVYGDSGHFESFTDEEKKAKSIKNIRSKEHHHVLYMLIILDT